ncbi:10342_t:CDS:2, partial [Paraglomus brasilianum]
SRVDFWNSIANTINQRFGTTYTGQQCNNRFQNLVRDYNSMCRYIAGSKTGKRSRAGERYFEEFNSHFWERPETSFDILHNTNTSTRRRRRNRTPSPTYEVATSERNENITTGNNQDNGNNVNNVNDVSGDSGRNANDVGGNSSNNTNDVSGDLGGNLDNATSPSELANITSSLNVSVSRNDSDISMFDVEGSHPLIWNL